MQQKAYLGIDVSKGYSDFILLDWQCNVLEDYFQLSDTVSGRKELKGLIDKWKKSGLTELYCGVESTGGYENNWHSFLKGLQSGGGLWVSRLNAKAVKSVSDASLRRTITDNVSATNIASYLAKFPEKVDYGIETKQEDEHFKEGRQFVTSIRMWTKQKVQLGNQLEKLLYQHLPELLVYCRNGLPSWLLRMFVKHASAEAIKKAGEAKLVKIKGITTEKAQAILKKLKESDQQTSSAIQRLISTIATEVLHQQELAVSGKSYLNELYKDDSSVKLLCEVKGIGLDSAVSIVLELENVHRFANSKKVSSYFGFHPTFKQSGDGFWGNHMSKKGRSNLRSVLYMAAMSAVRYNPMFKALYARFRGQGMKHKQAIGVVMHKMLRVIYGILKSGKSFDAATEEKHRAAASGKQELKKKEDKVNKQSFEQKKHRFQTIIETAPISGRNSIARKRQMASQTSTEVNTGSPNANANI
jgi:transposase